MSERIDRVWRVLIADDEPAARRGVRQLLSAFPAFRVVGECRDGREVLDALDRLQPDVLFLDIQMPEIDGLGVVQHRTPERMPATVFLTAYDRYALAAFDAAAHDYLVKPVGEERFAAAIRRLAERLAPRATPHHATPHHATPPTGHALAPERLLVASAKETLAVAPVDVAWVEAAGNYAQVWIGARSYLLREPMSRLEARLAPLHFVRVHRGALVRMGAVKSWRASPDGSLTLTLDGAHRIPVARRKRAEVLAQLRTLG